MNNETYDFEDRKYVNPTVSRDEQLAFIDNLRNTHNAEMQKIVQDTHNLGTDVSSNLGGLNGATGMWNQQYVEPRVNAMVSGLQATAQASALSNILSNYESQMKKRYNEAYRNAEKRKNKNSNSGGTDGTTGKGLIELTDGSTTQGDGSGEPQNMEEVNGDNEDEESIDEDISYLENQIAIYEGQLEQMTKKGHGPLAKMQWWEKLNPISAIGASNHWAAQYNKLKAKIEQLNKELEEKKSKRKPKKFKTVDTPYNEY